MEDWIKKPHEMSYLRDVPMRSISLSLRPAEGTLDQTP